MSGKLLLVVAVVTVLAGGVYKLALARPESAAAAHSEIYVMHHDVLVDLAGGRYATVTLGLEVPPASEELAESGVVGDVVTRDLTNVDPGDLLVRERRELLKVRLARDLRAQTDLDVGRVLLTDFTIH